MTTQNQIDANRLNALKSTGPRTPEGRARAAQNAIKHDLLARQVLLPCEDPSEFDALRRDLFSDLAPDGPFEILLVERIVTQHWRLRRAVRVETVLLNNFYENFEEDDEYKKDGPYDPQTDPDRTLGLAVAEDMATETCLLRMQQYESRIESGLCRALRQLHLRRSKKKTDQKTSGKSCNPVENKIRSIPSEMPNEPNFEPGNRAAMLLNESRSTPVRQEGVFQTPNEPNSPCHAGLDPASSHPERSEGSGPATMETPASNEAAVETGKIRGLNTNDYRLLTIFPEEKS